MTKSIKRITSSVVAILMTFAVFIGIRPINVSAASEGYNTGTRHEVCTSLSSQAEAYYTGSYTWENMSVLQGGNENCLNMTSQLFSSLHTLMSSTMTNSVSYKSLTSYWPTTDGRGSTSSTILFYSDQTSGDFNREHVWPKSHASFHQSEGGSDLHHLRPTDSAINSSRGSKVMGNARKNSGYTTKEYNGKPVLYHSGNLVEVNDNIKGDVARILLYVWCRWEEPNLFKNDPNPNKGSNANDGEKVIESLETLLEWCENDPVDTWEMSRNDQVQNIQGNRNVFIDYPEYAWLVFGKDVPETVVTPANHKGTSGKPDGGSGGDEDGGSGGDEKPVDYTIVDTPAMNTPYKLRCDKSTPAYFDGNIYKTYSWYLNTVTAPEQAIDVYVEPATDGYKLYFNKNNVKTYICMYQATGRTDASICISDGTNCQSGCTHDTVYSWNETYKTFVANVADGEYYIGSSDKYTSLSANKIANAATSSNYPAHLYAKAEEEKPHEHHYTTEVIAPNCKDQGYTKHTCECGDSYNDSYVAANGEHAYGEWGETNDHSMQKRTCSVCGYNEYRYEETNSSSGSDSSGGASGNNSSTIDDTGKNGCKSSTSGVAPVAALMAISALAFTFIRKKDNE